MDKPEIIASGHQIITDAMAKAKAAEKSASRSQAMTTCIETCLRELWALMMDPEAVAEHRAAVAEQAKADADAALQADIASGKIPPPDKTDAVETARMVDVEPTDEQKLWADIVAPSTVAPPLEATPLPPSDPAEFDAPVPSNETPGGMPLPPLPAA